MAGKSYKTEVLKGKFTNFLDDAYSDIQELHSELDDWASGMEEGNLASTDKCAKVREAADTLGDHTDAPEVPTSLSEILDEEEVSVALSVPRSKRSNTSRAVRLENACSTLDSLIAFANEVKDDLEGSEKAEDDSIVTMVDELENLVTAIETTKDEIEGVEIPGMYG